MIISRTPFRISFSGGGTDFPEFYEEEPGCVISSTIDKYIYLSMHPLFGSKGYHLKYFKNEIVDSVEKIQHPIIKEVFKRYGIKGVDFNSSSDVPSGTGLGSSSSFTVGLIKLINNSFPLGSIAALACYIEIDRLNAPIGIQDQYAAAFGGLNYYRFTAASSAEISPIKLSEEKKTQLEQSLMLFYLGGSRDNGTILTNQKDKVTQNRPTLRKMVQLTNDLRDDLDNNYIDSFGEMLHAGWMYKKELSSNVSNGEVDYWYGKARQCGAEGGKLLGGGKTGFMLFYTKDRERLKAGIDLYELPFKFENTGTTIIYGK